MWIVIERNVTTEIFRDDRMFSSPCEIKPRICSVLIIGGRTGLFSIIRSISNITDTDKRGSNWNGIEKLSLVTAKVTSTFNHLITCKAWRLCVNCSVVFALIKRHWTGSCFNVHAIDSWVKLHPSFSANKFKSRTFSKWRLASSTRSLRNN